MTAPHWWDRTTGKGRRLRSLDHGAAALANAGELAVELLRRVNADDGDDLTELFTPNARLFLPVGEVLVCHRGLIQLRSVGAWLRANLERHTLSVERISGTETSVTVDFETRGRSTAGVEFDRPGAMVVETERGRIRLVHVCLGVAKC